MHCQQSIRNIAAGRHAVKGKMHLERDILVFQSFTNFTVSQTVQGFGNHKQVPSPSRGRTGWGWGNVSAMSNPSPPYPPLEGEGIRLQHSRANYARHQPRAIIQER